MYLKNYQQKALNELKNFFFKAKEARGIYDNAPQEYRADIDWVKKAFTGVNKESVYKDICKNGIGENYPRIILKIPTGGGKTLLAVEAIREYQKLFANKRTGLIVWVVPSETIYTQTISKLKDKSNHLRQFLDEVSANRTLILEKGQKLSVGDLEENLAVLFIMIQSVRRKDAAEALKIFQDSGGFEDFFPAENRLDLHEELLKNCQNLDRYENFGKVVKTSLANAVRLSKPLIIIDEMHKVFSPMAKQTIDNLNPSFVLGLTATPKRDMNILISVSGKELKDEEMIKLDMHIFSPVKNDDWQTMLKEIYSHRNNLEKAAAAYKQKSGIYIRPIALIQVERTGKEQRGKGFVHSLDVKEYLQTLNIAPDEIAIKSSSQNDIENINLFSQDCPIRYIITKEALKEGWDCSFSYILGIIPNVNSNSGVTQLVGRILRQPFAKKTGERRLDESYVYYAKGQTQKILDGVNKGFQNEGLEDLTGNIIAPNQKNLNSEKNVAIKSKFIKEFSASFYLPVWLMRTNGKDKRKFSYQRDIKPFIDFSQDLADEKFIKELNNSLSRQRQIREIYKIGLDKQSKVKIDKGNLNIYSIAQINKDYLTRLFSSIMENPFLARRQADFYIKKFIEVLGEKVVLKNFEFISREICAKILEHKSVFEETLFMNYVKNNEVILAVSNNEDIGFKIPQNDTIQINKFRNPYNYYLFDDVDLSAMNGLEQKVGKELDKQEKIIWWFRNKIQKNWYSIQGWRENKVRPDFVAAKKNNDGKLEIAYIIESKGEHLAGNNDTLYKQKLFELMTGRKKEKYIQGELDFNEINENIAAYLIEDGKEQSEIGKMFK